MDTPLCVGSGAEDPPTEMEASHEFANIRIDRNLRPEFDRMIMRLKAYAEMHPDNSVLNLSLDRLSRITNFSVRDGSREGQCSAVFNSLDPKDIYVDIPRTALPEYGGTGQYLGEDGQWHALTMAHLVIHEVLAHAPEVDTLPSAEVQRDLSNLLIANTFRSRTAASGEVDRMNVILAEAGAVNVQNFLEVLSGKECPAPRRGFHPDRDVFDQTLVEQAERWYANEYPVRGACANRVALSKKGCLEHGPRDEHWHPQRPSPESEVTFSELGSAENRLKNAIGMYLSRHGGDRQRAGELYELVKQRIDVQFNSAAKAPELEWQR